MGNCVFNFNSFQTLVNNFHYVKIINISKDYLVVYFKNCYNKRGFIFKEEVYLNII